jgi:hypothetical protein
MPVGLWDGRSCHAGGNRRCHRSAARY